MAGPEPLIGAGHQRRVTVVAYIVRRLIAAVVLLFIVSAVTFSIFFLVPRLAGATADDLASRYVGKSRPPRQPIHATAVRLGFTDPIWVQYGRFVKGIVRRRGLRHGPPIEHCPAPCLGYSFITQKPVWPDLLDRLPVTLSLAVGAAVHLAGRRGRASASLSALRRGIVLRPGGDGASRWPASRCRSSSPACCRCRSSATSSGWTAPGGSYTPIDAATRLEWAYDLILPWITLAFLYAAAYARLTRAGMLETMGEDYIRTARAKGLPERDGGRQARPARRADPDPDHLRPRPRACCSAARSSPRATFSLPGLGKYADRRASTTNDLPKVLGRDAARARSSSSSRTWSSTSLYAVVDPRVRIA